MSRSSANSTFLGSIATAWSGSSRAAIVVFGGMLALQSSERLDGWKLIYLASAAFVVAVSVHAVWKLRRTDMVVRARPWLGTSMLVCALIAVSLPVSLAHGTNPSGWLRDVAAYALFAAVPWLALDAASSKGSSRLVGLLVASSGVTVLSFALEWMERRQLAELPIDRLTLPSFFLASGFFCVCWALTAVARGRRAWGWTLLGAVALGLMLLTGTRSTIILLAAPIAIGVAQGIAGHWTSVRNIASYAVVQVAIATLIVIGGQQLVAALPGLAPGAASDPPGSPAGPVTTDRFGTLDDVVTGADNSLRERISQSASAVVAFLDAPLLGVGPGYEFEWANYAGDVRATSTLDTPLVVLGKFGLAGLAIVVAIVFAYVQFARHVWDSGSWRAASILVIAFGATTLATLPLGWPIEDKGFSFALIFVVGAAYASADLQSRRMNAGPENRGSHL